MPSPSVGPSIAPHISTPRRPKPGSNLATGRPPAEVGVTEGEGGGCIHPWLEPRMLCDCLPARTLDWPLTADFTPFVYGSLRALVLGVWERGGGVCVVVGRALLRAAGDRWGVHRLILRRSGPSEGPGAWRAQGTPPPPVRSLEPLEHSPGRRNLVHGPVTPPTRRGTGGLSNSQ